MEIHNGLNIKDTDTQNDSDHYGFTNTSKTRHTAGNRKWKSIITKLIITAVPENPKNEMCFSIWKPFLVLLMEGFGKSLCDLEISNNTLKKQAKSLPLLDTKNVDNIILLLKVVFWQLKQCHIPQGLNQELQNLPYASSSPLTTKQCDRYVFTVAPIIDLFVCL